MESEHVLVARAIAALIASLLAAAFGYIAPAAASTQISGSISSVTPTQVVLQTGVPHGLVPVWYSVSIVQGTLKVGATATATGVFYGDGSFGATSVVVAGSGTAGLSTLAGTITSLGSGVFVVQSGPPHGYVPVYYATGSVSGTLAVGSSATMSGTWNSNGSFNASTVTVGGGSTSVARHVPVWTFYGANGVATNVPASWMAAHADFVMATVTAAQSYKAAGGRYTVTYTDPVDVIVANHEPLWDSPESTWFHDSSGYRITRQFGSAGVQESLNPTSSTLWTEFANLTAARAASGPFDFNEVDNINWERLNAFYNFSAPGVEVSSDLQLQNGVYSLLQYSKIPVILNGLHVADYRLGSISGNTVYLPVTRGGQSENCLMDVAGPRPDAYWQFDQNTLLYTTNASKIAVCEGANAVGTDARAPRMFFLASWWLTYDPNYSVAFPMFTSGSLVWVFPEYDIVPTGPLQNAGTNISNLRTSTGIYARQFSACYQAGSSIGGCAAFANSTSSWQSIPTALLAQYHHALVLDGNNSYAGGLASWTTSMPTSLGPSSGVILAQ